MKGALGVGLSTSSIPCSDASFQPMKLVEMTNKDAFVIGTVPLQGSLDWFELQGGKNPQNAFSHRSFSDKEPLIIRLFCGK